jgi:serine/threonine protein kinase
MTDVTKAVNPFTDIEIYCMKIDNFKIIKEIGEGSTGKIYMAEYIKTGDIYALKIMKATHIENVTRSLKLSSDFNHPNLMKYYGYFFQKYYDKLYIICILEYIEGKDLHQLYRRSISDINLPEIICHVISGLQYIHDLGIIHRDIKLENIIVTNKGDVKIIDYDFLIKIGEDIDICGTPYYIAPEVIEGININEKSDIWSLGVAIYLILVGDYPFDAENSTDLFVKITKNKFHEYLIPDSYRLLLKAMLEKDPNKRISLADIITILKRML